MNIVIHRLDKAELFTAVFQHIKVFNDRINIHFENERLYLQSMDSARVLIFEMVLSKDYFDEYENTRPVVIGINSVILFNILNTRDKTQKINIQYEHDSDRLHIHFTGENKQEHDKHFEIPLIDLETDMLEIPEMEYQAEFTIGSTNFANIINQLKLFGDSIEIKCSEEEDKILLSSNSTETGKMTVDIKMDDLSSFAIEEGGDLNLSFGVKYLHNILLYNKLTKELDIKLSNNYPMCVCYNINETSKLLFYLAPKINDE
jgi:proliferating cell nuclear antigen PCNA